MRKRAALINEVQGEDASPDHIVADLPETVIEPSPGLRLVELANLWRYREVLYLLVWRDIKVRYKQTVLGVAWAILQPLGLMMVLTLFSRPPADVEKSMRQPYGLFVFAGLLPWFYLANSITSASQSVVANHALITKVFFPRLLIPVGAAAAGLIDFAVGFVLLLNLMAWYDIVPGWNVLLAPLFFLGIVIVALGVGIILSALTVAYRDFRHAVPWLVLVWMFLTPAVYIPAIQELSPAGRLLLTLNPVNKLIENFRNAMFGMPLDTHGLALSFGIGGIILIGGCLYFRRAERDFADII